MKSIKEFLAEFKMEIPSIHGTKHASDIRGKGLDAVGDAEGVVVTLKTPADRKKLKSWMLDNGWDMTDIRDAFPALTK